MGSGKSCKSSTQTWDPKTSKQVPSMPHLTILSGHGVWQGQAGIRDLQTDLSPFLFIQEVRVIAVPWPMAGPFILAILRIWFSLYVLE